MLGPSLQWPRGVVHKFSSGQRGWATKFPVAKGVGPQQWGWERGKARRAKAVSVCASRDREGVSGAMRRRVRVAFEVHVMPRRRRGIRARPHASEGGLATVAIGDGGSARRPGSRTASTRRRHRRLPASLHLAIRRGGRHRAASRCAKAAGEEVAQAPSRDDLDGDGRWSVDRARAPPDVGTPLAHRALRSRLRIRTDGQVRRLLRYFEPSLHARPVHPPPQFQLFH